MLLARAAARRREVAVRTALGASRGRIVRQLLTESLLLALAGGLLGVLLAVWGTSALVALGPQGMLPRLENVDVDGRVLLASFLVSLFTGLLAGLFPAFEGAAAGTAAALKEGGRGSTSGPASERLRGFLVASEIALALVLAVGAGLMMRSFVALQSIDPGFEPRGVLSLVVSIASGDTSPATRNVFYPQLLERIAALPGIRSVSAINHLPLVGDLWRWSFWVEGRPMPKPGEGQRATFRAVLPGYFRTMGIALLRGRDVAATDAAEAPGVVIVNDTLARQIWPGEDAVGKRITLDDPAERGAKWLTVIGVARNAKRGEWTESPGNELYTPLLQTSVSYLSYMTLVVRGDSDPARLQAPIREVIRAADSRATVSQVLTMDGVVAAANGQPRFYLTLFAAFAALALALAAVGIYGVMSYLVSRRSHEVAIRMALGAKPADVVRLVVGEGMHTAAVGALIGIGAALALSRVMRAVLYETEPTDPATFVLGTSLLALVALLANYLPARRATRIEPLAALRHD
jgi:putative ABC transport system permease protein